MELGGLEPPTSAPGGANLHSAGPSATLRSTIVAKPLGGGLNCSGTITSQGYNPSDAAGCGLNAGAPNYDQIAPTQHGPLALNGGPTQTMLPALTSPAIDHGVAGGLTTDQRGFARTADLLAVPNAIGGDGTDIGAVEHRDADSDGIADLADNCLATANPGQADIDADGSGDACDSSDDRTPPDGGDGSTINCTVPAIQRGSRLGDVRGALEAAHCTLGKKTRKFSSKVKRGRLIRLKVKPGTVLDVASAVDVVLSKGPNPD